ncbi:MAG: TIGR03986 family CRISPR-associated RAMP protein, partial [Alphaproteobacteria bacterium]|nr:TIGR03986 family CRISPR-associated RAMP protein [Alphaproteobacteria bacterium]
MTALTAPYAFVPLNHKVFLPDWAERVSFEVPMPGAISGSFEVVIEAETPLMIGAGSEMPWGENGPKRKLPYLLDGKPAIPGSSLRGMLRNVLEIAALGKIGPRIDDRRHAMRDLHNARDYLRHMTEMFRPLSRAGWLSLDLASGEWRLNPCEWSLVPQTELETLHRRLKPGGRQPRLGDRQQACRKYESWSAPLTVSFQPGPVSAEGGFARGRLLSRAGALGCGPTSGTIVFTGQPQNRDSKNAKATEFIFHGEAAASLTIPAELRDAFEFVHRDPNNGTPNEDWARWRRILHLPKGRVPVFWLADASGAPKALGLAMMFRLAGRSTRAFARAASDDHLSEKPDLAETVFGWVREEKGKEGQALRGRVHISPARIEAGGQTEPEVRAALLAPKPQFHPAYVGQRHIEKGSNPPRVMTTSYESDGKDRPTPAYTTWMSEDGVLRGWKRYPVTGTARAAPAPSLGRAHEAAVSERIFTVFSPLRAGTRFRARVLVHNLLPEELGALFWVLTFGGEPGLRHALGMARPLGYGQVKLTIDWASADLDDVDGNAWTGEPAKTLFESALNAFTRIMDDFTNKNLGKPWAETATLRNLKAMADTKLGAKRLADGQLDSMEGPKPFQNAKKLG